LTEKHVRKWVQRFLKDRLAGLRDRPGRGRKPVFSPRGGAVRGEAGLRTAG
jgi:transposase